MTQNLANTTKTSMTTVEPNHNHTPSVFCYFFKFETDVQFSAVNIRSCFVSLGFGVANRWVEQIQKRTKYFIFGYTHLVLALMENCTIVHISVIFYMSWVTLITFIRCDIVTTL